MQGAALAVSVSVAGAVIYVAHRRGREIAAPVSASEPRAPDAVAGLPSRLATSGALVPPSSALTPKPEAGARDKKMLRGLYGLQGPSTKAEPHLAKALYEEIARHERDVAPAGGRDGGAPR